MADFINKVVVLQDGKLTKVGPADNVEIGGKFTAGELAGDGALVTNIAEANVVGLSSALSTLTSAAAAAQSSADAAASAASAAQSTADGAVSDAAAAQSTANSAVSAASAAQGTADSAVSAAAGAQADATLALSNAAGAQSTADSASTAAAAAQSTANTGVSDAAAAQSTADSAVSAAAAAQTDATQALADAASASSAAAAAQGTANTAVSDAAAAQGTASGAASAAAAAQSTADSAVSAASAAQSSANAADAAAAAAQSTADSALADAYAAQATANTGVANAAAAQSTADSAASAAAAAQATADAALPLSGGTLTGDLVGTNLSLSGDLVVAGNIVNKGQLDVIISDSFLDLNAGNVLSSATAGGFTVNVAKASGFTAETATAFVGGVVGVSAPSISISGSALAAGDIIQVSASEGGKNDGLYVVAGVAGSVVSIKGIGGSMPSAQVPFVQNQLIAGSGESAIVVKVDLAALAVSNGSLIGADGVIAAGAFCSVYVAGATEGAFSGAWAPIASMASATLQAAYNNGDGSIALVADKPLHISGDADVQLDPRVQIGSSIGFAKSVAAGVAKGDILFLDSDGVCKKASSVSFSDALYVALEANAGGSAATKKVDFLGEIYVGITGSAPAITDKLFLSATAGLASKAAPASGTIVSLGAVVGAAVGGLYPVKFSPVEVASL
jgi:hypothetical protein